MTTKTKSRTTFPPIVDSHRLANWLYETLRSSMYASTDDDSTDYLEGDFYFEIDLHVGKQVFTEEFGVDNERTIDDEAVRIANHYFLIELGLVPDANFIRLRKYEWYDERKIEVDRHTAHIKQVGWHGSAGE